MNVSNDIDPGIARKFFWGLGLSALAAFAFYWLTCFRTFTWWDSSAYSAAALTLGIPQPPGSLLTVIAGWAVSKIPLGIDKFFALNLLSSAMASVTVLLAGSVALNLYYRAGRHNSSYTESVAWGPCAAISVAALFFGLSATTWYYAVRFTPYTTTILFTALIILAMLAWQRHVGKGDDHLWLGVVTLLFGLDFSVHRTNLLILPGLVIWILLFHPKAFLSLRHWIYGLAGLLIGLAVHLLIIPIAAAKPLVNSNDPSSLARLWDYVSLKQYGGGWLINMFPRKAPFLKAQITDYIKVFRDNFVVGEWPILRFLPLVMGIAGLVALFKRNWRIGLGLTVLFLFSSLGAVVYFNLPENFFRSIDRHYMPSFVIFGVFIAYGAAALIEIALELKGAYRAAMASLVAALLILMPIQAASRNFGLVDGSKSYFAYDTAKNYLANLPPGTILFTQADIDTYTLWCLQIGENFRRDVTVCNISLLNTPWYIEQVLQNDKEFPVRLNHDEIASLSIIPWHDSAIVLPVGAGLANLEMPGGTSIPDSVILVLRPTFNNQYIYVHDQMILKTVSANNWGRPICFSALLPETAIGWLMPNLRFEGLWWRLVPAKSESEEMALLRENLLQKYNYRGYADPSIPKDDPAKWLGWNFCSAFMRLAFMEHNAGGEQACIDVMKRLESAIAPENLSPPPDLRAAIANACR